MPAARLAQLTERRSQLGALLAQLQAGLLRPSGGECAAWGLVGCLWTRQQCWGACDQQTDVSCRMAALPGRLSRPYPHPCSAGSHRRAAAPCRHRRLRLLRQARAGGPAAHLRLMQACGLLLPRLPGWCSVLWLAERMSWTAVALCMLADPQDLRHAVGCCRLGHLQPDLCSSPPLPTRRRSRTGSRAVTSNSARRAAQAGRRRLTVALPQGRRAGQMMVVQRQEVPRSSRCAPTPIVRRS